MRGPAGAGGAHLLLLGCVQPAAVGLQSPNHHRRHTLHHFGFWCFHFPCWGAASGLKSSYCLSICRQDRVARIDQESSSEWASLVAQTVKRLISWRRKWQPTPVLLPGKFHRRRSLAGYSLWDRKESDTTEQLTPAQSRSKVHTCWEWGSKQKEGCQVQPGLGVHPVYLIKARISSVSGGRVCWFHWIKFNRIRTSSWNKTLWTSVATVPIKKGWSRLEINILEEL